MHKSWPGFIITLFMAGAVCLGFGIFMALYMGILKVLVLFIIGIAFVIGGACVLRWYLSRKG